MRKILFLILALILVAGCAQQVVQQEPENVKLQEEVKVQEAPPEVIEIEEKNSYVLSSELQSAIDLALKPGVKGIIPLTFSKLAYGEVTVFGVGVQNIKNSADRFQVKVTFDKAHDKMTNPIMVDEATMQSWVKTNLDEFTLENGEKQTVAIVIEVGDIKPGVKPSSGSYIFDVETLAAEGGHFVNKDYLGKAEFAIKVE